MEGEGGDEGFHGGSTTSRLSDGLANVDDIDAVCTVPKGRKGKRAKFSSRHDWLPQHWVRTHPTPSRLLPTRAMIRLRDARAHSFNAWLPASN